MGAKTFGFHSVAPRCVRTTRWGRCVNDSGRPGIVQRRGMAGIVRHSQTKGRATGNAKPGLKPSEGRCGYKRERNSGRCGARSRIGARYSRTRSEQKVSDRHLGMTTPNGPKRPCGGGRPRAVSGAERRRTGKYMTEVRTSSLCERPCAGIEDTPEASIGTGGRGEQRHRKVHSLIDKVYDRTNLTEAWKHVRENKGSAGIDGLTIAAFTERQDELLARLHEQLRNRTYRPRAVKRVAIPKAGGGTRNLGIPSVADRVVQQALVQKMTPIFEPLFADCSFGYRPGRSPHMAMRKVWREINEGNLWILDADLRSYFDKIDQERLVDLIAAEISDGRVLQLIRSFLEAGAIIDGAWEPTKTGVPQGGVASPLWSNIYLTPFDHAMTKAGYRLTRWADDFVVVCRTRQEAEAARATARAFLHEKLGVSLHPEKTRIVHVTNGFEFLGYKIGKGKGLKLPAHKRTARTNPLGLYAVPRQKSVDRFKDQIRNLTRRNAPVRLRDVIEAINPVIRGWGNYYRKAQVRKLFHRMDGWIERRLRSFVAKKWRNTVWRQYPLPRLVREFGLVRLIYLVPGINPSSTPRWRPHRKAACGKTARAV